LLEGFNPRIVEALSRTGELLREDKIALEEAADRLLQQVTDFTSENQSDERTPTLRADLLGAAPAALRRRALRKWIAQGRGDLRRIELAHIRAVESLLAGNRGGRTIELPGGATVTRRRNQLRFHP